MEVVSSIMDISEKTNMLALNASIEAAHTGSSGSGFAVISGEIRKLSMETRNSTQLISDSLKKNQDIISSVSSYVKDYLFLTEKVLNKVQEGFASFEEIVFGLSEITSGAKQVKVSTARMLDISSVSMQSLKNVVNMISESTSNMEKISGFSTKLQYEINNLKNNFDIIENNLGRIMEIGNKNIEQIRKMETSLDASSD